MTEHGEDFEEVSGDGVDIKDESEPKWIIGGHDACHVKILLKTIFFALFSDFRGILGDPCGFI